MITLSLDVLLLQKSKFKEVTKRDGKKAMYCELVLIETPDGQYGDYMVKQGSTKEERASKVQMPILGNAKIFKRQGGEQRQERSRPATAPTEPNPIDDDSVPF